MPQVESLTVQILGDSSGLQQELNSVAELLDSLQEKLAAASEGSSGFGSALGGISTAMAPLQSLSAALGQVTQQVQALSNQTISLNVQPALEALAQLIQAAQAAAAQIAALSAASIAGPMTNLPYYEGEMMTGVQAFASGGVVTGPSGIDQVPAWLTAGEFVLNKEAVASLGINELDRLNRGGAVQEVSIPNLLQRPVSSPSASGTPESRMGSSRKDPISPAVTQQTMNHFGGIEIHVQEASSLGEIMGDLRRQGIGLRKRWG